MTEFTNTIFLVSISLLVVAIVVIYFALKETRRLKAEYSLSFKQYKLNLLGQFVTQSLLAYSRDLQVFRSPEEVASTMKAGLALVKQMQSNQFELGSLQSFIDEHQDIYTDPSEVKEASIALMGCVTWEGATDMYDRMFKTLIY